MPLTDLEFALWAKRLISLPQTLALIKHIRSSPPSRRGIGWGRSMTGVYPSRKMGVTIHFDSHTVEFPGFLQTLEYDPDVLEYFNQPPPITLSYTKTNTKRPVGFMHTPDVFVIRTQTAGWEEWKPAEKLEVLSQKDPARYHRDELGDWRCPPGETHAKSLDLYYRLRSSAELSPTLHRNLIFLDDYHTSKQPLVVGEIEQEEILGQIRDKPGITLTELISYLRKATADHIYILIVQHKVYADLFAAPLAEPDRVHLFRDQETATIYTHAPATETFQNSLADQSFTLVPGTHLSWDNRAWEIINVGETDVYLKGEGEKVITLSPKLIEQLAKQGKLLGLPSPGKSPQAAAAEERIKHASTSAMTEALRKYSIIEHRIKSDALALPSDSTPQRTIREWVKKYHLGVERFGMGILGLLNNFASSGNRAPRFPEQIQALIDRIIEKHHKKHKKPTAAHSHKVLDRICRRRGQDTPSYESFCRYIRLKPTAALRESREGKRAAYKNQAPLIVTLTWNTPRQGDRPFEIGHIDHTELPIELVDSLTGKVLGRPWATFLSDAFSRVLLAIYLSFASPSYRSCMMVLRICRMRHSRWPQILIVDRGAEFQSISFDFALAADTVTKKLRPSSDPRFGSTCERLFNTSQTGFIHNLAGNTQATREPRTSTPAVDPKHLACWTLERFYARLNEWANSIYAETEHGGIHETPQSAFIRGMSTQGAREHRLAPYSETWRILTLPVEHRRKAKIIPGRGIQHENTFYWNQLFQDPRVERTFVDFRADPDDLGSLYAFVNGRWVQAVSDHHATLSGRSYRELQIATAQYRKRAQLSRQRARTTPAHVLAWWENVEKEEEDLLAIRRERENQKLLQIINAGSSGQLVVNTDRLPSAPAPDRDAPSPIEPPPKQERYLPQTLEIR